MEQAGILPAVKLSHRVALSLFALGWSSRAGAQTAMTSFDAGQLLDGAITVESEDAGEDAGADGAVLEEERPAWMPPPLTLPPAQPDPAIEPIVVDRQPTPEPAAVASEDRPAVVTGTVLGLFALLALAFLGGHARVQELERRLGISQVITAGFPFVLLGLLVRGSSHTLLGESLLTQLSPLLRIGLGSIGFVTGFRFSAQFRSAPTADVVRVAAWATLVPFALVAALSGAVLLALSSEVAAQVALRDPVFLRDALILGTAGAMTARTSTELFRADDADRVLARVLRFEELAGIIGLAVVAAYFRTDDTAWQLPGTAWLLLTLGLGTALGLIAYVIYARPQKGPEFVLLTLGAIGFGAGTAGYLRLSPVVVCFAAGTCVALLPVAHKDRIRAALRRVERPTYLLSLIVIGALWQVDDYRGWLLMPVFTVARFAGKWLGTRAAARFTSVALSHEDRQVLAVSPMGPLAIAIVVNAQLLYPGGSISPIVAAVIGGAILTEIVVQLVSRRGASGPLRMSSAALTEPPEGTP